MKFEMAVAVVDEADLASGHKRKKQGDIVAIRPHPWNWGRKEVDEYLIVIADLPYTYGGTSKFICDDCSTESATFENGKTWRPKKDERGKIEVFVLDWIPLVCQSCSKDLFTGEQVTIGIRSIFQQRCLEDGCNEHEVHELNLGMYDDEGFPVLDGEGYPVDLGDTEDRAIVAAGTFTDPVKYQGGYRERPAVIGKNRFKVSFTELAVQHPEFDLAKTEDKTVIYQPFKKQSEIESNYTAWLTNCVDTGRPLGGFDAQVADDKDATTVSDVVDCGLTPNEEKEAEWTDSVDLVKDNVDGTLVKPPAEVITP
jgi:hypothetical protein